MTTIPCPVLFPIAFHYLKPVLLLMNQSISMLRGKQMSNIAVIPDPQTDPKGFVSFTVPLLKTLLKLKHILDCRRINVCLFIFVPIVKLSLVLLVSAHVH